MLFSEYKELLKIDDINVSNQNIKNFFVYVDLYDNNQFERIKNKSRYYSIKEYDNGFIPPIGCYPNIENNRIVDYKVSIPYVEDIFTGIINVHELIHSIILDSRINNAFDEFCLNESVPMFYEKLFIYSFKDAKLLKKYKYYLSKLSLNFEVTHLNGFNEQEKLNNEYEKDNITFIKKYSKLIKKK
jgi:hypothetical protein